MEVTRAIGRHPRKSLAIWRPAWLDIDGMIVCQRTDITRSHVELRELHRVVVVANECNVSAIGRPVGLKVITGAGGELLGLRRVEALFPEAPLHRVHERLSIG